MQAILNVNLNELDRNLLKIIEKLLLQNVEVVIRKNNITIEEYDKNIPLDDVMLAFKKADYSKLFLEDLEAGLKTSTVYSREIRTEASQSLFVQT